MKTVLLVEDDHNLAEGLTLNLEAEGYQVVHVADGSVALDTFSKGNFDIVLLDIMLPGMDGLTICRELRSRGATLPVLFLTARHETEEKVEGLLAGGDDYITKPFDMQELLARMQGVFRRQAWLSADDSLSGTFEWDERRIDFRTFEATGPQGSFVLTRKECMVIKYFVERKGQVVSRDQLLDAVWGYHIYPTNRTIDNFIMKLRKIFEDNPKLPKYFETIRGVGYRFLPSQESAEPGDF
ncbi:MAG: response regulator transcription factor [Candidatus Zixiibacteriota bacterium]